MIRRVCPDISQKMVLPSCWPSGPRRMAVPKDRVDRIGVSSKRSLSFQKAILFGPLDLEDEGNPFLRNLGKFSSMHTASHYKILQSSTTLLLQPKIF
jgi:hypothetical protein